MIAGNNKVEDGIIALEKKKSCRMEVCNKSGTPTAENWVTGLKGKAEELFDAPRTRKCPGFPSGCRAAGFWLLEPCRPVGHADEPSCGHTRPVECGGEKFLGIARSWD